MQKNLYQVQQSTVKYCFSFRSLLDRNMKMGCMLSSAMRSAKTSSLRKILSPRKLEPTFYAVKAWKPISILERTSWLNHHFIIKKNKRLDTRLRKPDSESSLVTNIF